MSHQLHQSSFASSALNCSGRTSATLIIDNTRAAASVPACYVTGDSTSGSDNFRLQRQTSRRAVAILGQIQQQSTGAPWQPASSWLGVACGVYSITHTPGVSAATERMRMRQRQRQKQQQQRVSPLSAALPSTVCSFTSLVLLLSPPPHALPLLPVCPYSSIIVLIS